MSASSISHGGIVDTRHHNCRVIERDEVRGVSAEGGVCTEAPATAIARRATSSPKACINVIAKATNTIVRAATSAATDDVAAPLSGVTKA